MANNNDFYLKVYLNRSELVHPDGTTETFEEGAVSEESRRRSDKIRQALSAGFLETIILECREGITNLAAYVLDDDHKLLLDVLVNSVTAENGRALVGLVVLQLCVKAIEPQQSIRLHKGGPGARDFSWRNGISMRSLDSTFITPVLRKYDLLKLNADGFMMTRSLAENYPYSQVYKANLRGARKQWLQLVEEVEQARLDPTIGLKYLIAQLINRADSFASLATETLVHMQQYLEQNAGNLRQSVYSLISDHIEQSKNAARIMEIAMHSLMQAINEFGTFGAGVLEPLSQMRSANKKHGNVADIEILEYRQIVEAWDAKYGIPYLRDQLEELDDKLQNHPQVMLAGFVTTVEPIRMDELLPRMEEIQDMRGTKIVILTFSQWVQTQFKRANDEVGVAAETLAARWLVAYTETIAQRRRPIAPIDEPCFDWLLMLKSLL